MYAVIGMQVGILICSNPFSIILFFLILLRTRLVMLRKTGNILKFQLAELSTSRHDNRTGYTKVHSDLRAKTDNMNRILY